MNQLSKLSALALVLATTLVGCDEPEESGAGGDEESVLDSVDLGGDKSDTLDDSVEIVPGDTVESIIVAEAPAGYDGSSAPYVRVFHFAAQAGETYGLLMAGEDDLDPHIIVAAADKSVLAEGTDQALVSWAEKDDALVSVTSESEQRIYVICYTERFAEVGYFSLGLARLEEPPALPLDISSATRRIYHSELASKERELSAAVADGTVIELPDGNVEATDLANDLPTLRDFAELKSLVEWTNSTRADFFDALARESEDGDPEAIRDTLGSLWSGLR